MKEAAQRETSCTRCCIQSSSTALVRNRWLESVSSTFSDSSSSLRCRRYQPMNRAGRLTPATTRSRIFVWKRTRTGADDSPAVRRPIMPHPMTAAATVNASADAALALEGVTKAYEGHLAVDDLSFTIARGSVYG